ncbi:MBL fold metallo-hydrolase [soil metagenome]
MKLEQIYTGCLAQGAYYIESNGEAAVIDPLREVLPYLDRAKKDHAKIKFVFETHFHADFVSGHIDLANASGATIVYGPNAQTTFSAHIAKDEEEFKIGDLTIRALHTPGHTMESTCYLLIDENGKEIAIFTGDTLFIGDVGRPDLAQKSDITQDDLAGMLYDSLRTKIMILPDDIMVYPAHGAGSACGKNMSKETVDTLGRQKQSNYALRADMSKAEFVKEVTDGLLPPPAYFPLNVMMNKQGYASITEVIRRGTQELNADAFELVANSTNAILLDTRDPQTFAKGFIPNAINIGIDGQFAPWVGSLIPDIRQEILIIAPEGREEEVVTRLARVGYDHSVGYLKGGFKNWQDAGKETDQIESISVDEFADRLSDNNALTVVDVRKPSEFETEHVDAAISSPLDFINSNMSAISKEEPVYIHCQGGYRSMIYISILRARGYSNLIDVKGGFKAIQDSGKFTLSKAAEQKAS